MTSSLLVMSVFALLVTSRLFLPSSLVIPFTIASLTGATIGLAGYWLRTYVVQANIIEMNFRATGISRAGTYIGINGLVLNAFQAVAYYITGLIAKYDVGFTYWTLIAGAFILVGAWIFQRVSARH